MKEDSIKRSLRYSIYDGTAYAVMEGCTASFLTPFAVALNASLSLIAALTYVPQLAGSFMQLFASKLIGLVKDRKRILVVSSFIHAVLWVPLLLMPYATEKQKYLIIIYVSLQEIVSQIMNPVWNSWMGDLVPKYERGAFFALRNKIVGISSFAATLAAGLILNYFSPKRPFLGFAILFFVAFAARAISGVFKNMMENPPPDIAHEEKFSITEFVKRMDKTNYGHFVIYIVLFKFAVNIASPFFAVYLLKSLKFTYMQFTIVTVSELIASFFIISLWGRLIDSRGTKFVFCITGILASVVPMFWLFSANFYYLAAVAAFSGVAWSGFNLSSSNFIFDAVKPENRVRCISYYKFFEGMAIFMGAALGGALIDHTPKWLIVSGFFFLFLLSAVLRLLISILMLPALKEARLIELGIGHSFFKKYLTIRPSEGIVFEVIGRYHGHEEPVKKTRPSEGELFSDNSGKKESEAYKKKLLKFIGKNISSRKEKSEMGSMHDIEHITEEIEKGRKK